MEITQEMFCVGFTPSQRLKKVMGEKFGARIGSNPTAHIIMIKNGTVTDINTRKEQNPDCIVIILISQDDKRYPITRANERILFQAGARAVDVFPGDPYDLKNKVVSDDTVSRYADNYARILIAAL